ncbi:hypothetical protein ADK38_20035, partial [Streptomyces varsoviensis]
LDDALAGGPTAGTLLKAVKEQSRAVPAEGPPHATRPRHGAAAEPRLLFTHHHATAPGSGPAPGAWRLTAESAADGRPDGG